MSETWNELARKILSVTYVSTALIIALALALIFSATLIGIIFSFSFSLFGLEFGRPSISQRLPDGIVVASTRDCRDLGTDWRTFEDASGRFILGAGGTTDTDGAQRTFLLHEKGGAFTHLLKKSEMPEHGHGRNERTTKEIDFRVDRSSDGRGRIYETERLRDENQGGGLPHNNVPPYIALQICTNLLEPTHQSGSN